MCVPESTPVFGAGQGKVHDHVQPALEGGIEAASAVAGEDDDALERFDSLQQIVGLGVGEAIVRVPHVGALAEQRIGFVEETVAPISRGSTGPGTAKGLGPDAFRFPS
jgi:hypothetical protein